MAQPSPTSLRMSVRRCRRMLPRRNARRALASMRCQLYFWMLGAIEFFIGDLSETSGARAIAGRNEVVRTRMMAAVAVIAAMVAAVGANVARGPAPAHAAGFQTVAYFDQWSIYGNAYYVKNLETEGIASRLSVLIYDFENIDPTNLTCFETIKASDATNESDPNAGDGAGDAVMVKGRQRLHRAEDRTAQRVIRPEVSDKDFVDEIVGRVFDHLDLFHHDVALAVEFTVVKQRRGHQVSDQIEGARQVFVEDFDVVSGNLAAGEGVNVTADGIAFDGDLA